MIKIFDDEYKVNMTNTSDLDVVLEKMEEVDEFYVARAESNKNIVEVDKKILIYTLDYLLKYKDEDAILIIKQFINNWNKFNKDESKFIYEKLSKKIDNDNITDEYIQTWVLSLEIQY